jgi:hypothetical protein
MSPNLRQILAVLRPHYIPVTIEHLPMGGWIAVIEANERTFQLRSEGSHIALHEIVEDGAIAIPLPSDIAPTRIAELVLEMRALAPTT